MDTQAEYLMSSLEQAHDMPKEVDDMVHAWQRGDTAWLESELKSDLGRDPAVYQSLLVARNRKWISRIEALLDDDKNYLVIVGTAHLVGRDSVIELLKKDGVARHPTIKVNWQDKRSIGKRLGIRLRVLGLPCRHLRLARRLRSSDDPRDLVPLRLRQHVLIDLLPSLAHEGMRARGVGSAPSVSTPDSRDRSAASLREPAGSTWRSRAASRTGLFGWRRST